MQSLLLKLAGFLASLGLLLSQIQGTPPNPDFIKFGAIYNPTDLTNVSSTNTTSTNANFTNVSSTNMGLSGGYLYSLASTTVGTTTPVSSTALFGVATSAPIFWVNNFTNQTVITNASTSNTSSTNLTVGSFLTTANGSSTGAFDVTNRLTAGSASSTGGLTVGTYFTAANVSSTGEIGATNRIIGGNVSSTGNLTVAGQSILGNVSSTNETPSGYLTVTGQTTSLGNLGAGSTTAANLFTVATTTSIFLASSTGIVQYGFHAGVATTTANTPTTGTCGTGSKVQGSDISGIITVGTGGTQAACTLTFGTPFIFTNEVPIVIGNFASTTLIIFQASTTGFVVSSSAPFPSEKIYYQVLGAPY